MRFLLYALFGLVVAALLVLAWIFYWGLKIEPIL